MKIGIIGSGRVGTSFGMMLSEKHDVTFYSSPFHDALYAAHKTLSSVAPDERMLVEYSDVIFITVPDSKIKEVWDKIKDYSEGKIVCHMSGALTARDVFGDNENTASLHPMMAVSDKETSLKDAYFTVEGEAGDKIISLMETPGVKVAKIPSEKKALYHAACVLSSNGVIALLKHAAEKLKECGFEETEALCAMEKLATANMKNVFKKGFEAALTGPVDRGDTETVSKNMDALGDDGEIYRLLSQRLIEIAKNKNGIDYEEMEALLK